MKTFHVHRLETFMLLKVFPKFIYQFNTILSKCQIPVL